MAVSWAAPTRNRARLEPGVGGGRVRRVLERAARDAGSDWPQFRKCRCAPLVVTVVDGERYFVSMLGNDAAWVKNVRAANGHATLRSGGREPVLLEELAASERPSILRAYLQRAPGARAHIPVDKNAGLTEFEQIASAYPV